MDCQTIATRAGLMIDETINKEEFVLSVLNDFQEDIANQICPIGSFSIDAEKDVWYNLPSDFIQLYCDDNDGHQIYLDNKQVKVFEFRDLYPTYQIKFYDNGVHAINYEKTPTELISLSQSPDMHPYLQPLGVLYLAARYAAVDDREDEIRPSEMLMNDYLVKKLQRIMKLRHPSGEPGRVVII